ncbi:MAG: hypothetical protein KDJ37_02450, partial [Hyphomicrobiaceae bacterium]|nr:hypothetical protein [Hyphomicrobiaceae bacterium]
MLRRIVLTIAAAAALTVPALAQEAGSVAGRPALTTDALDKLIKQREQWGKAPAKAAEAKAKPPVKQAAAAAAGAVSQNAGTVAGRPALATDALDK